MGNRYENAFMEYFENGGTREEYGHHAGLMASGLTEQGLCTVRGWAGKKPSMKPGVFYPIDTYDDWRKTIREREGS